MYAARRPVLCTPIQQHHAFPTLVPFKLLPLSVAGVCGQQVGQGWDNRHSATDGIPILICFCMPVAVRHTGRTAHFHVYPSSNMPSSSFLLDMLSFKRRTFCCGRCLKLPFYRSRRVNMCMVGMAKRQVGCAALAVQAGQPACAGRLYIAGRPRQLMPMLARRLPKPLPAISPMPSCRLPLHVQGEPA